MTEKWTRTAFSDRFGSGKSTYNTIPKPGGIKEAEQQDLQSGGNIVWCHGMGREPILYSVIEEPGARGQRYTEKAAAKRKRSFKENLRQTIDRVLPGCADLEEFLSRMRAEGYEVKRRGRSLEFRAPDQERFTRSYRLGDAYTFLYKINTAG